MISAGDVNSLKQKVSIMEKELSSNALKLNTSENLKKTLEQKVAKYEKEMKDIDNSQVCMLAWLKVFRINPEFRILRLTFHRKSALKS